MFLHIFDARKEEFNRKFSLTSIKALDEVLVRIPQPHGILGEKATGEKRSHMDLSGQIHNSFPMTSHP